MATLLLAEHDNAALNGVTAKALTAAGKRNRALALYTALALALRAPGSTFTPIVRYVVGKVSPGEVFW